MARHAAGLLALGVLALSSETVSAAGFSSTDRSVVAMGSGGAGSVRTDDPATNAYNPATAAMTRGLSASLGVVVASAQLSAHGPGWSADTDAAPVAPPMLHLRWGGETFALGASLTVPFGSRVVWPSDWPGRFDLVSARLSVLRTSAFAAVRFDRLAVAAGPFVDLGSLQLERALDFIEVEGKTSLDTTATGVGLGAAVFYRAHEALDLGLAYQSRSRLSFSGWADFSVPQELRGKAPDQELTTRIRLPDRLTLGALLRANDELELLADVEVTLWSTVDRLVLDFASADTADVSQPRAWSTTITPRLGASYHPTALPQLRVRAGAFFDPSPVPSATASPSAPDSARVGASLGASVALVGGLSLDAGYQLAVLTGVAAESATASLTSGVEYGGQLHLFGASLTWHGE